MQNWVILWLLIVSAIVVADSISRIINVVSINRQVRELMDMFDPDKKEHE